MIKQFIKQLVVPPLSANWTRAMLRPLLGARVPIFMLHRVTDRSTGISGNELEEVRSSIRLIRQLGVTPVSLQEIAEACAGGTPLPPDCVAFTIDDGFADQLEFVRVFEAERCPVTVFLITDMIDGNSWPWDYRVEWAFENTESLPESIEIGSHTVAADKVSVRNTMGTIQGTHIDQLVDSVAGQLQVTIPKQAPDRHRPMSWSEIRSAESDYTRFAPHSLTHRIFSTLDNEDARREIVDSWERLRAELTQPVPVFGWPMGRAGDFTGRDAALVREAGLMAAVAARDDYANLRGSPWHLCRFALPDEPVDLRQCITWIHRAKQLIRGEPSTDVAESALRF